MKSLLKQILLHLSKWSGLFWFCRQITQSGLRIICYHAFSLTDEDRFRPGLFMNPDTFRRRMELLAEQGYPVLELDEAVSCLEQGTLPSCAAVITFDDGWYSIYTCALEPLRRFSFPATVYVTTYYYQKANPIFRLVVQYMFWKTDRCRADFRRLQIPMLGDVDLEQHMEEAMWEIIRHGESRCRETQRSALLKALGACLGVDYGDIVEAGALRLMNRDELLKMKEAGIDIQLHTHRHRFPTDERLATKEIADNRAVLEPLLGRSLEHFCYPDGRWSREHGPWLRALNIKSATTCDLGLNYRNGSRLALNRFCDGEQVSQIEFEAEMCGYLHVLRQLRLVRSFLSPWGSEP